MKTSAAIIYQALQLWGLTKHVRSLISVRSLLGGISVANDCVLVMTSRKQREVAVAISSIYRSNGVLASMLSPVDRSAT